MQTREQIAEVCQVSVRTLRRFERGESVQPALRRRIVRGLVDLGLIRGGAELDADTRNALGFADDEGQT
jgi:transcriptional regulator with XRE-family HTH domain